ncbi:MAG: Mut7-C RNAse domain-containing protein [Burkholderiales bacterium]
MAQTYFRFYEELNDFLPPRQRQQTFSRACAQNATVKHAIEALGVPHTEVELVLVNGSSVDFSYRVQDGDRVSVYPQFESLDVTPLLKVRDQPLRHTRFIVDAHLGRLAKYLRMLGFDTLYCGVHTDDQIARIAAEERRIVLTRDRELLKHRVITHGCFVRATSPAEQLGEILSKLDLYRAVTPFSRCLRCNATLVRLPEDAARERVPQKSARYYREFWICTECDQVYWQGSHWQRMQRTIDALCNKC